MNYAEVIQKGISYLKNSQNEDGGIPIRCINDKSGYWTTAEVLEAVVSTIYLMMNTDYLCFVIKMVNFLLNGQIITGNKGYWKEDLNPDSPPSTVTTAHAIYSLKLFQNNILGETKNISITVKGEIFEIDEVNERINRAIDHGTRWLLSIKNNDDGWGRDDKESSNVLCTYYVLKGLSSVGKSAGNDHRIKDSCYYLKRRVKEVLIEDPLDLNYDQIKWLLYGYSSMKLAGYFQRHDKNFEEKIVQFINTNWIIISNRSLSEVYDDDDEGYDINLPWITLNVLLNFDIFEANESKITTLLEWYINQQQYEGFWTIDNGITTWITAEIINDFNLAQTKFVQYENDILVPRKVKVITVFVFILLSIVIIGFIAFLYMFITGSGSVLEKSIMATITLVGLVSSVVTIYSFIDKM